MSFALIQLGEKAKAIEIQARRVMRPPKIIPQSFPSVTRE